MALRQQHSTEGAQRKKPQMTTENVYWTRRELAARIGVSVDWLDRLVAAKRIPCVKLSHKIIRFPVAAVEAWIAQRVEDAMAGKSIKTCYELTRLSGLSVNTAYKFRGGSIEPGLTNVLNIARALGTKIEELGR